MLRWIWNTTKLVVRIKKDFLHQLCRWRIVTLALRDADTSKYPKTIFQLFVEQRTHHQVIIVVICHPQQTLKCSIIFYVIL